MLLGVGLIALLVAAIAAGFALGGSATASGGASSPEEAVDEMIAAIGNEDMISAAELLLPSERETMIEPVMDMIGELQRLEVLDLDRELSAIPGIDLEFENMTYAASPIRDDMTMVSITGGTTTVVITATDAPLGRLVLDRLPAGTLDPEPVVETGNATEDGNVEEGIIVVERGGRWFVSLWYTVAEAARTQAGYPLPDLNDRIQARGAESAEAAVEETIQSGLRFDIRRMLELLSPDEAEALQDYAPLFIADAEAAFAEAELAGSGVEIGLARIGLESKEHRGGPMVTIHGGRINLTSD
ncbi:MAG: hypothetical protein ACI91O_000012 [Candidatus Poriferisodalaceae bacterium]